MAPEEHFTYFSYREGYDCKVLRLGSLVAEELSKLTVQDKRNDCYMRIEKGGGVNVGSGLLDYASFAFERSKAEQLIVVAKTGSKTYLLQPHEYFEQHVLASPEAKLWLSTRLSVSRQQKLARDLTFNHPKLWMLTGIYVMECATTMTVVKSNAKTSGQIAAPVPDPIGVSALLDLKVGAQAQVNSDIAIQAGAVFEGERVWAAQWQQVKAKYFSKTQPKTSMQIWLTNTVSVRTSRGQSSLAELELDDMATSNESTNTEKEYSEEDWADFDRQLDSLLASINDEDEDDSEESD
ncbi:hypothetical protein G7054_g12622 [Neopestalotiopsis clavispora]|nr:hypothetical protein G7054_g12622 [Neopestalotiopsis clavispora]